MPPEAAAPATPSSSVEELYELHAPLVWRTVRALGVDPARVDDAVQDVFLVVHRRLAEFDGRSAITTWLYGIARRVAAGYRRKEGRVPVEPERAAAESPLETAQRRQAAQLVLDALAELDDDRREVFALIELEQLTAPAVAEILGVPVNTVYSRLRVARQRFEAAIARRLQEEP